MKIYIVTDMEGVSGICNEEQVKRESPHYGPARHLLCADVNAAIQGAFDGGATQRMGRILQRRRALVPIPRVSRSRASRRALTVTA